MRKQTEAQTHAGRLEQIETESDMMNRRRQIEADRERPRQIETDPYRPGQAKTYSDVEIPRPARPPAGKIENII